ncbi:CHAT domain-containing protein [Virgisporangium aurantiacum]|uniref:CHAT domain-containing protein n=1 Tax=Virgisporangium aurantiacum TaxID=175570 RepID=A0A8J3Z221_9ACTN|nr:tetratricopeptide repeat protein [Virgisporangium aurantiacum]GIJ54952.1 CHAT domain-containing protein [Virgisporangium aurantiacum]
MDDIDRLRADTSRDPRAVVAATTRLAAGETDPARLSRVLSIRGRARRHLGEIDLAEHDLTRALAGAGGDPDLEADARLGLAVVVAIAGRPQAAMAHLDEVDRTGPPRAKTHAALQRAVIHQCTGDQKAALAAYELALPVLDQCMDVAKVLVNRGVIRIHLGDCDGAVADYTEAGAIFEREGHPFGVAESYHGLGWAHARRGDLPRALTYLDLAAEQFDALGHSAPEVAIDRVEVLLAAGLNAEATDLALTTADRLAAAGNHMQAAETWLLCARARMLDGDRESAAGLAERARSFFAAQGLAGWERTARLEVFRCRDGNDPDELTTLAAELDAAGNARGAAAAFALAAIAAAEKVEKEETETAAGDGDRDTAARLARECARRSDRLGIFEIRMLATYAGARCALAAGNRSVATRRIRAGLADLRRHRSSLAAADARAAVAVHAADLARLGLRAALRNRSAAGALDWMERVRAGSTTWLPARPPDRPDLAADLAELREVGTLVREREVAGDDTTDLLRRQRDLERTVHSRQLRLAAGGDGGCRIPDLPALREALAGRTLVALAEVDGHLVGVRLAAGRARLFALGPAAAVVDAAATALSALRSLITPRGFRAGRGDRVDLMRRALGRLDHVVLNLFRGEGPVVLVVPAALHAVPWHLLPCLARRPVAVAPSATWWHAAETTAPAAPTGSPVRPPVVVSGPRLLEAAPEAVAVAAHYPGASLLTGPAATAAAVTTALDGAPVAHLACHARVRPDNPLWSSLELADGPLYVFDLERVPRLPAIVVLSGCHTGVGIHAGDGLLGLSATLLTHGTRSLVAAVCALPDTATTRDVMTALHARIAAGVSPAAALADLAPDADAHLTAACLAAFGTT